MIHTLLDDDQEWFNIPTVIRQVLKLLVKETSLTSSHHAETLHELGEVRQSVGEWVRYTRLLESDSRERIAKLELDVTVCATDSAERCVALSRQVADVTALASDHSSSLKQLERNARQTKTDLFEAIDSNAKVAREETVQQIKSSLLASMAHCDSSCADIGTRCDALQTQLKEGLKRSSGDIVAQSNEIQALHKRSLLASAAVKEALSSEMVALSNRTSAIHQTVAGIDAELKGLSTKIDVLHTDSIIGLPKVVAEIRDAVDAQKQYATKTEAELQQRMLEGNSRMERHIDERTEYVVRRSSEQQSEVQGILEELNSDLAHVKIDIESFQMKCMLELEELRMFLELKANDGSSTLRTVIEQLSQKSLDRESAEWTHQLTSRSAEVVAQIHETREQISFVAERDRQSYLSTIESLRADLGSIRSAVATTSAQQYQSIVDIEKDIGALRNDTQSNLVSMDRLRQQVDAVDASVKHDVNVLQETWKNERNTMDLIVERIRSETESTVRTALLTEREELEELQRGTTRRLEECIRQSDTQLCETKSMLTSAHGKLSDQIEQLQAGVQSNVEETVSVSEDLQRTRVELQHMRDANTFEIERLEGKYASILQQLADDANASTSDALEMRKQLSHLQEQLELVEENAVARVLRLPSGVMISAGKLDEVLKPMREESANMQAEVRCLSAEVSALLERHQPERLPENTQQNYFSPLAKSPQEPTTKRPSIDDSNFIQLGNELRLVASRLRILESTVQNSHETASTLERVRSQVSTSTHSEVIQEDRGCSMAELDDRFESFWGSLLMLLARKEDHASLETKLAALRDDVLMEAVSRGEALFEQIQVQLQEKVNMSDLMQMFGSRNL